MCISLAGHHILIVAVDRPVPRSAVVLSNIFSWIEPLASLLALS